MSEGIWTILAVVLTYVIMVYGYMHSTSRRLHMTIMTGVMMFDALLPFYFIARREWYLRFIAHEDILTFGVWMHFMLVLILYVLYAFQIYAARRILSNHDDGGVARRDHRAQGTAILLVRAFVILSGIMLYDERYLLK